MNTKQKLALWLSIGSFVAAALCAVEVLDGDGAFRGSALLFMFLGLVFGVGIWATGLPRREDADTSR